MPETKYCNFCGNELDEFDLAGDLTLHTAPGYGSTHDGDEIFLQLCYACFDKIVDSCKISPVTLEANFWDETLDLMIEDLKSLDLESIDLEGNPTTYPHSVAKHLESMETGQE